MERSQGKPSILVVDDNPGEVRTLSIGFDHEGFAVAGATNGDEAMARLTEGTYSVVLIDMMMPGMNGLELARAVRESHPRTPTILMSAYHLSPLQLARADTGAVGFVPKPFDFDELVTFVRRKIGVAAAGPTEHPRSESRRRKGLGSPFDVPEQTG